jgi:phytoene dehydrogenase-like protein
MATITVVGGGIAGLTAAISCAEQGGSVAVLEAHQQLGGRGRSDDGPYKANLGPHALLASSPFWRWLGERDLLPPYARPPLSGVRFRWRDEIRRVPAVGAAVAVLLSAAFVWDAVVRGLLSAPPTARYPIGGWQQIVDRLHARALQLGVSVRTRVRVEELPDPPVIVATELADARELLGDRSLRWPSGHAVCLDLALAHRRGDPFVVVDLQEAGWIERFTAADRSLAPAGEELIQAQMPIKPGESVESASARLERLLDAALVDWRERETWRRRRVMEGRTGALDPPGKSWRDRPAVDRGGGVFLAGDMAAAPGCLSEIAWASAIEASRLAVAFAGRRAGAIA